MLRAALTALERALVSRPRAVLACVGVFVALAGAVSVFTGDRLQVAGYTTPGAASTQTGEQLRRALGYDPEPGLMILARTASPQDAARVPRAVGRLLARVRGDPAVAQVTSAFGRGGLSVLLSRDRRASVLLVHFRSADENRLAAPLARLTRLREQGLHLQFGGYAVGTLELNRIAREDLVRAELFAFPLLALLVLLIFRGLLGAAIPLIVGAIAVLGTFAALRALSHLFGISIFALNLATLLGLGLAVDYGLLLVTRYREEAATRGHGEEATRATLQTAGRTVAMSALAVAGACAPLVVFPQSFIYSMGIAGVLAALLAAGAALSVTGPLLSLAGGRIGARAPRPAATTRWYRWARWVMRHPLDLTVAGVLILVAAAAPALQARTSFPDRNTLPPGSPARSMFDALGRDFVPNLEAPVSVLAPGGRVAGVSASALAGGLNLYGGGALAAPLIGAGGGAVGIQAVLRAPPLSDASIEVVRRLRTLRPTPLVGGRTAQFIDLERSIGERAPFAALLACILMLLVLLALTRSVVLAIKALAFHALVILAVLGLLVLVFQRDVLGLSALVAYRGPPSLDITIAVVIVASTLGLAADYSVLLLARVSEEHRAGHTDEQAVARAIERTGPVVTSAGVLLSVALLALTTSKLFLIKQLAVGQVLGVVIDISLVRLVLVPAFMRWLGSRNWWAPRVLRRDDVHDAR